MTNEKAITELSVLWERMKRAKESGVLAYKTIMYYDGQYVEALDLAIKALEQTRPNGTWKEWDTTFGRNIYYCTACGRSLEILYKYDFCPLCGADMRGDSE